MGLDGDGEARFAEQLATLRTTCPTADTCCLCLCAMERGQAYLFKKCLHSICATCATQELANEGRAVCAVCCEQPGATSMADLVENGLPIGPGVREDAAPPAPCSLCAAAKADGGGANGDDPAAAGPVAAAAETCKTCGIVLCGPHARLHHKAARTRAHELAPISDPSGGAPSSSQMCAEHDEPWRAYCTACVTIVCNHCRLAQHLKCGAAVFPLGPAATAQVAASLAADPVVIAQALLTADLARAAAYDAAVALTTQRHADLVDALTSVFATITADVDAREAALRQQLEAVSTTTLAALDAAEAEALEQYRTLVGGAAGLMWPSAVPDTALVERVDLAVRTLPRPTPSSSSLEKATLVVDGLLESKVTAAVTTEPLTVRPSDVDATTYEQEHLAWNAVLRGPAPSIGVKRVGPPVPYAVEAALAEERLLRQLAGEDEDEDDDEDDDENSDDDY